MIRFLLIAVLFVIIARSFWRTVDGIIEGASGRPPSKGRRSSPGTKLVRDPVCGTYIVPNTALSMTSGRNTHYFCSDECRRKYSA